MYTNRRSDIEAELSKLGWTGPGAPEVHVYEEIVYRERVGRINYEYTVYARWPVWKWDFVNPIILGRRTDDSMIYTDVNLNPGDWLGNLRWDWESEIEYPPAHIAQYINQDLEEEFDNVQFGHDLKFDPIFSWKMPIQRITDRPTKEQLSE